MTTALRGNAISPGYAEGRAYLFSPPSLEAVPRKPVCPKAVRTECKRLLRALQTAYADIAAVKHQVAADIGEHESLIFDAHLALLHEPQFKRSIQERIVQERATAERALADEIDALAQNVARGGDDYLRERAVDIRDVGTRVLHALIRVEGGNPLAELPEDCILVARDLMPTDTITLDRGKVAGLVLQRGGVTSHAAILARSLGIPAVSGIPRITEQAVSGSRILLDGVKGAVVLNPSEGQRRRLAGRRRQYTNAMAILRAEDVKACRLRDGTRITLAANICQSDEVDLAVHHNMDGIGLYRTEMLYLAAPCPPPPALQYRQYCQAAKACGKKPLTIRTFDFAPDKRPVFLGPAGPDGNGRGLAFAMRHHNLLKTQLRAIVRSARACPNIRLTFPMVSDCSTLRFVLTLIRDLQSEEKLEHPIPVGAMIETPASLFLLPEIIRQVDFITIGCNDLAQYLLALDRDFAPGSLRDLTAHPAMLRALKHIIDHARQQRIRVSVCGEAASDPVVAALLVGLGYRELSISPALAPEVRYALRHLSMKDLRNAARKAFSGENGEAAFAMLRELMPPPVQELDTGS